MMPLAVTSRAALAAAIIGGTIVLLLLIFVLTQMAERAGMIGRRRAKVPSGLRPGPSDEALERRLLERYIGWGAIFTLFMAIFLPVYWLREPTRIADKEDQFVAESVARGERIYGPAGVNCASCHGAEGEGGVRQYLIPGTDRMTTYAEPPLAYMVARYKAAGRNDDEIKQIARDAIERGRPGTPMPTWGLTFGGPLNSQQLDDIMNYMFSEEFQQPAPEAKTTDGAELYAQNCAICHGAEGQGGVGPNLTVAFERQNAQQIFETIFRGRVNQNRPSMPAWAHLGRDAVRALVEFIRSIQVTR